MAKQLNKVEVNLEISASTEKAKKAFMDLNKSLSNLQNQNLINPDNGIRQAAQDARELQTHLSNAVNVDTGKLDLNRFSNSLKKSNKELKDYYDSLIKLGPDGEQAFLKLSRSIATAETSTIRVNKKLQEFGVTLKNAARWQISSSILHGFMGAIQGAYGYAKDLDGALNDIRIVTSASADEMDKFAVKANQAAKALSTTTTEYAKASLIYFQQGLSDSEVEERTNITIKMANAANQSAETISDQLTAVWNNFYDGSQSLEHFADAMVRLGADTASSSDEIATGLEKFASIGSVIGLGFDEAAAALATVTAQTRQSAEVVGTAFKTIFARIQGLNLGETLDDGTTLNKYSEALAKVGISIKDQYGGIKDMNTLLDEMGAKWSLISKDQQIALAQAVGGVRQYNQIVALMDNYDFYRQNLEAAENAEGSLEEQAGIYADRWEASENRVRAAAEGIYDSLINEEFFISFNNNLSMLLEGVEGLVDGFGGMEGVLSMVGSLALRYFAKDIPSALANTKDNIVGLLGLDSKGAKKIQEDNNKLIDSNHFDITESDKKTRIVQIEGTKTLNKMNQKLNENLKSLSAEERKIYEEKIRQVEKDYELLELQAKELETEENVTKKLQQQLDIQLAKEKIKKQELDHEEKLKQVASENAKRYMEKHQIEGESKEDYDKRLEEKTQEIYQNQKNTEEKRNKDKPKESKTKQLKEIRNTSDNEIKQLKQVIIQEEQLLRIRNKYGSYRSYLKEIEKDLGKNSKATNELKKSTLEFVESLEDVDKGSEEYKDFVKILEKTDVSIKEIQKGFDKLNKASMESHSDDFNKYAEEIEKLEIQLEELNIDPEELYKLEEAFRAGAIPAEEFEQGLERLENRIKELPEPTVEISEAIAQVGSGIMGFVSMASGIENIFDVFNDENATAIQKISAIMGGLTSTVTAATGAYKALDSLSKTDIGNKIKQATATSKAAAAEAAGTAIKGGFTAATVSATAAVKAFTASLLSNPFTAIAATLTILIGVLVGVASAAEKAKEKRAEEAKVSKELADATYEEIEANKELKKTFDETLASYKKGKSTKEELVDATQALCDKYDIENAELLIATENYEALAEAIRKAENEKLKAAQKNTEEAVENAEDVFEDQMRDGVGHFANGNYTAKLGGGASSEDEKIVENAIKKLTQSGEISNTITHDGNDINLKTGQTTEDLIKLYEDAQKLKDYVFQNFSKEDRDNSETYQNLVSWLEKSAESYENLIALQEQLNSENVQIEKNKIVDNYGEVESYEEYLKIEEELANNLSKSESIPVEDAKELARQALMAETAYSEMAKQAQIIGQASNAIGNSVTEEELQNFYNSLSDEAKTLFVTLDIDEGDSIEDLEEQIEVLQAEANRLSIKTKIENVQNAQSNLKSNMDVDDYRDFETSSGIEWGQNGVKSYAEFLSLTFEEQTIYLEKLEEEYDKHLKEATQTSIDENVNLMNSYENKIKDLTKTMDDAIKEKFKKDKNDVSIENFEDYYLDEKDEKEWLNILKTTEVGSEKYNEALNNLKDSTLINTDFLEEYVNYYKQTAGIQIDINNLQQKSADLVETDQINAILKAKEKYEEIVELSKILSDLEVGETIDADQYMQLTNNLPELAENFEKTIDGAYRLKSELGNIYVELSNLKDDDNNKIFSDFEIASIIPDLETLRDTFEKDAISAEAFSTRWAELNEVADLEGLGADELKDYSKHLQDVADDSEILSKELKDNDKAAKIVAKSIMKMNDGIDALADGFEDWSDIIKNSTKESEEYNEAVDGMRSALSDTLDVSEDFISDNFIEEQLIDIEKAANGDADAINRLKAALATDIIKKIVLDNEITGEKSKEIIAAAEALQASIPDIKVGATIDTTKMAEDEKAFLEQCQKIISDANMTAEQANAYFDAMGFETTFKSQEQAVTKKGRGTVTVVEKFPETTYENPDGSTYTIPGGWQTKTYPGEEYEYTDFVETFAMATSPDGKEVPQIDTITKKATGAQNDYSGGNAGGGSPGSSSKTSSKKNTGPSKSVKPERYKEINDKLDDASNAYEKASKAADRLYGPKQIAQMREVNKELSKEISLLKIKQKQANEYLNDDKEALEKASADLGLKINIDDNNFITNYTDLMNQADQKLKNAYANAGDTIDDEQQEVLDALEKKVEDFEAAIAQFDETRETLEDIENEVLDKIYERQDRNFEILNKELEIKIDIDDRALDRLEYYADKFSDNFYKLAETYALIIKGVNNEGVGKIDLAKDKLAQYAGTRNDNGKIIYGDYMRGLEAKYHNGDISQVQYVEGLKDAETNIRDTLTELNGYDKEMLEAYGNALDAASSEIEDHVDHIEHLSGVFDHYLTLMEMFGKQKEYAAMDNFLTGKADTIKDRLDVAKEYYEALKETNKAEEYWNKYQEALKSGNEDDINWWKKQWDAEVDALDAAQEEMLSLTEEWAEARRAIIENHMAKAADDLEKSLTNGYGFEFLNDEWDKMNTRQEEYLDNVNKVYETNKLMRTAQKALDETDNKVAKQKLKGFIDETQHLQENTNLSEHELEIQQAKYDLLLAEIALEDAQNAKSTVRLSRDSEGNFGYVYTADQDKVADAQQGVDDKRNDLYNLTLEGQKEYTEKYLQASQEMYEELTALQEDYFAGLISKEQYEMQYQAIEEHYLGIESFRKELAELEQQWRDGEIESQEDYEDRRQDLINRYNAEDIGILNQYHELASVANKEANAKLAELDKQYHDEGKISTEEYEEAKKTLMSTYADTNKGIVGNFLKYYSDETTNKTDAAKLKWGTNLTSMSDDTSIWKEKVNGYLGEVETAIGEWEETYKIANTNTSNALDNSETATRELKDESKRLRNALIGENGLAGAEDTILEKVIAETRGVRELTGAYANNRSELLLLIAAYEGYLDKLSQKIDAESGKEEKPAGTSSLTTDNVNSKGNDSQASSYNNNSSTIAKKKNNALDLLNKAWGPGLGTDPRGWKKAAESGDYGIWEQSVINLVYDALSQSKYKDKNGNPNYDYEKAKNYINSYDTGGYTGMWGPEGKLALLHEKEIVLNKDDTENLLKTVSFIRELVSMIDSQASISSLFNMTATTGIMTGNAGMEQQITIYADFPDATDHNEIEMAFNTLLNTASQYANRK